MRKIWLVVLLLFVFSRGSFAQSTGTINGRVADPSGAVVAGATVTATNAGTGIARKTVTTSQGDYSIPALTPGSYNVSAEASGFAKSEKKDETLVTGTALTVDFALGLAASVEKVEVTTEAPMVELTQSGLSDTLQTNEVQDLPVLNRNFSGLVALVPSARPTLPPSNAKISMGGGLGFSGGAGRNGVVLEDGVPLRDDANGGALFNVTLEGVQEFNVIAHDYPAQYGQSSGGAMLITTKSGTNQLHGSALAFGRNQDMTALDYFSNPANQGTGKPPYSRIDLGGSLGGRIVKDKLFVFGAVEDQILDQAIEWPGSVTTQAKILKTALSALTTCPICVTVGNAIGPASYAPETLRDLQMNVRADYQINANQSLFARFSGDHDNTYDDILEQQGGVPHPDNDPNGSNNLDTLRGYSGVLSHTWVINNTSVNTAAIEGTHFFDYQSCNCTLTGAPFIYRNIIFPDFQVGDQTGATNTKEFEDSVYLTDTYSRQAGKHAIKLGGEFTAFPHLGFERDISGTVTFFDDPSVITTNSNGKYPNGFLTPGIMKTLSVSTVDFGGPPGLGEVEGGKEFGFFFQDDWKIKPRLTVNLGLRYSANINFFNESNQNNNRALQLLKAIGSPWGAPVHTPYKDLSPRVGFAWDPRGNGKNVIKASFGIYFDESLAVNMISVGTEDQPLLQNVTAAYTNTTYGSGQIATSVYGGPLPVTLAPGLSAYVPGKNASLTWLDPQMTDPYNEQAHIGYTHQITSSTVISVDYTHVLGLHEIHSEPVNPTESTAWDPSAATYTTCPGGTTTATSRRLECAFQTKAGLAAATIGAVSIISSSDRSQYNEMIVHFEQRTRPVTIQANYVLSYAYAFGGAIAQTGSAGGAVASEIPFQWFTPTEWGPSSTDERNRFVVFGVINLPWKIQASPIFQIGSARPYNCLVSTDYTKSGDGDSRCVESNGQLLTTQPATLPLAAGDTSVPVNFLRGTATWDWDTRFSKIFKIRENTNLSFFAELYNLTNKANFGNNYGGTYGSATFEQPLGYLNQGLSLPTSRQLQLGARFTF